MAVTVIADTSALLAMFEFKIDVESELQRLLGKVELLVPSSVIDELKGLSKRKRSASAALGLIVKRGFKVVEAEGRGDAAILDLATRMRCPVLTNDSALKLALRERSIPVIYLRGLTKLEVEGAVL